MNLLQRFFPGLRKSEPIPQEPVEKSSEKGRRPTPERSQDYLYRLMWVDPAVRQAILDIREMDRLDGRVKRIHGRVARDVIKGGLVLTQPKESRTLRREWDAFSRRLQLDRVEKLRSDARGLVMEGTLSLQWVLDGANAVAQAVRMPSETIIPDVTENGVFKDVRKAYVQMDPVTGRTLAEFALWQLFLCRFDPDNFDDMGSMGRPFLDASRTNWRKLTMTEEDLVIRRRHRAPLRLAHVLEGASKDELDDYRLRVEKDAAEITTDYYLNRKGGVNAVQGDSTIGEISDVVHLMDTFFAGSPLPKGLMGYTDGLARDILEDLKRDYYEEVDSLQDTMSFGYAQGFRLHLLLKGMAPDPDEYSIEFAERRTETPSQTTDRMLKWAALGLPKGMVFEEMGFNAQKILERLEAESKDTLLYPGGAGSIAPPGTVPQVPGGVKITPGNAPKGESATTIGNRLGEHWDDSRLLYDPEQPRAPKGSPDGGQWTSGGGGMTQTAGKKKAEGLVTEGDHPVLGPQVPVRVISDKAEKNIRFEISGGHAVLRINPVFATDKQYVRLRAGDAVDDFLWPFEPDVYVRSSDNKHDFEFIKKGTHRGSINHATGEAEGGLSVARSAAHAAGKYAYFVKGKVIGSGSDGEPLLSLDSAKVVSERLSLGDAIDRIRVGEAQRAEELGITDKQRRALKTGQFKFDFSYAR